MAGSTKYPRFTSIIEALPDTVPFVAPEELERAQGATFLARLGANESAFGISDKANEALIDAVSSSSGCSWYGDPLSHDIRSELAKQLGIDMRHLCVDGGIDTLLGLTVRLFMQPGDVLVTSAGAYPTVNYHAIGVGGEIKTVPYRDNHEDTVALAEAAHQHNARLVYLANPDNPMGTQVDQHAIHTLIQQLPDNCTLLLDEAYVEFMGSQTALPINSSQENVVRFRTFSKAYGMAGMRIGYAISTHRIMHGYDKIRNHFGINRLAQIAALASLNDQNVLPRVQSSVQQGRQRLYELADSLQLPYVPSATNFVAIDLGTKERASKLLKQLGEKRIFMRKPMHSPQDRYIRAGVGTDTEFQLLRDTLPELLTRK